MQWATKGIIFIV